MDTSDQTHVVFVVVNTENEEQNRCSSSSEESVCVSEIKERRSRVSATRPAVDLESGVAEDKAHLQKVQRDCRICHLSFDASNQDCGLPIELGCSCKDDLAAAHKQCADTWFKIKGNKICEVCGSMARNVASADETESAEQWNETDNAAPVPAPTPAHPSEAETRRFWQGHRFLNFLLACMVFAFVVSWLFHFNVPS